MKNLGSRTIETERLILRKARLKDIKPAYKNWMKSSRVTKYLSWGNHKTLDDTRSCFMRWIKDYKNDHVYHWIIDLKEIGEPIGTISAVEIDESLNKVALGYCIGEKWWNKGLMTESLRAVVVYFFEEVGVNRLEAFHDLENPASGQVMEKAGLKFEGVKKSNGINNDGIYDEVCYGLIRREYIDKA